MMISNLGNDPNGTDNGDDDDRQQNLESHSSRPSHRRAIQGNEKRRRVDHDLAGDNETKQEEAGGNLSNSFVTMAEFPVAQQGTTGGNDSQQGSIWHNQFLFDNQHQQAHTGESNDSIIATGNIIGDHNLTTADSNQTDNRPNNFQQLWSLQNQASLLAAASSVQPDPLPANFLSNSSTGGMMQQEQNFRQRQHQQQEQIGMGNLQMPSYIPGFAALPVQQTNQAFPSQQFVAGTNFASIQQQLPQQDSTTMLSSTGGSTSNEFFPPYTPFGGQGSSGRPMPTFPALSGNPMGHRSIQDQQLSLFRESSLRSEGDAMLVRQRSATLPLARPIDPFSTGTSDAKAGTTNEAKKPFNRPPISLFLAYDDQSLSEYQCLVRKQIELFEAGPTEVESNAKGRNKPIVLGQVGIRCRHCCMLLPKKREKGAMYYPAKLNGLYQAAQSMASLHLCEHCKHIPPDLRQELLVLREKKSSAGGGKKYWGDGITVLGVYEDESGLRFRNTQKK